MAHVLHKLLRKPDWEHKDPEIRRRAVAQMGGDQLRSVLPELARHDESPLVRVRAVQRLTSLELLREIAQQDADATVRDQTRERYRALLTGTAAEGIPLEERLEATRSLDEPELVEDLVRRAQEDLIREAALERVRHQGVLAEVAIGDTSPDLRRRALQRIERESTLGRIAEETRRHDKTIHRLALERLHELKLARGDEDAVRQEQEHLCRTLESAATSLEGNSEGLIGDCSRRWRELPRPGAVLAERFERACAHLRQPAEAGATAGVLSSLRKLCQSLEQLARDLEETTEQSQEAAAARREHLAGLERRWEHLVEKAEVPEALGKRFQKAREQARTRIRQLSIDRDAPPELKRALDRLDADRVTDSEVGRLEKTWAQSAHRDPDRYRPHDAAFKKVLSQLRRHAEKLQEQRRALVGECEQLLDRTGTLLENGDFQEAQTAFEQADAVLEQLRETPAVNLRRLQRRAHRISRELREMSGWQHWANDKQRARMCEEAETLPELGLEPPEQAKRVKALRARWKELERSEKSGGRRGRVASPRLWRRFDAACTTAWEPCAEYFEARSKQAEAALQDLSELADRLEKTAQRAAERDWQTLERCVRDGARGLRRVGRLHPRQRGTMARRLRSVLSVFNERLGDYHEQNRQNKQALITRARGLAHIKDLDVAVKKVRELEDEWKLIGATGREQERELLNEFREACGVITGQEAEKTAEERAARSKQTARLAAICKSLEDLDRAGGRALLGAEARIWQAQGDWDEVGLADRTLEKRFEVACDRLRGRLRDFERQRQAELLEGLRDRALLCIAIENASGTEEETALRSQWESLPALDDDTIQHAARQRYETINAAEQQEDNLYCARILCLRMELLAGLESPDDAREERLNYRVEQLSRALSGGAASDPDTEAWQIQQEFWLCGTLPPDQRNTLVERFQRACATFGGDRA